MCSCSIINNKKFAISVESDIVDAVFVCLWSICLYTSTYKYKKRQKLNYLPTNCFIIFIQHTHICMHSIYTCSLCGKKNMVTSKYLFLAERNTNYFFSILIGCWCFVVVISYNKHMRLYIFVRKYFISSKLLYFNQS